MRFIRLYGTLSSLSCGNTSTSAGDEPLTVVVLVRKIETVHQKRPNSGTQIAEAPRDGRNVFDLAMLPGVISTSMLKTHRG